MSDRRLRRPLVAALVLAMFLTLFGSASPAGASPSDDEHEFLRLLNQDRVAAGLPALVSDATLASTSRSWSSTMAAAGKIYHASNLGQIAESIEPAWQKIGENVGVGYDVGGLHTAFMNSPGHRDNIMGGYNRVGIGVVHVDGKTWVTVRFLMGSTITGITGLETPLPTITQRGIDNACSTLQAASTTASFTDISGNTHAESITCLVGWGIANGKTATTYEPGSPVTRQQLATFVRNMLAEAGVALPAAPANHFGDDDGSVHHLAINQLAELGVVTGKAKGVYSPASYVSRAEMATFLVRAHKAVTGATLTDGPRYFNDTTGNAHETNINRAAHAGIAAGTSDGTFAPKGRVNRAQMATFICRTLDLLVDTGEITLS
jgi:hypothetical protein